jgi:DNA processing protein
MASAPDDTNVSPSDLLDHVRLACIPGIGARLRKLLLERFGSPAAVFAASPGEIRGVAGIGKKLSERIPQLVADPTADEVIAICRSRAVDILLEGSKCYPPLLSRIDDPPGMLFVRGAILPADSLGVAVVGARHATAYGIKVAEQLGGSLARAGYTVVSGLARGIDAAAHRGALAAGGCAASFAPHDNEWGLALGRIIDFASERR